MTHREVGFKKDERVFVVRAVGAGDAARNPLRALC
jgi:hypothetical protein